MSIKPVATPGFTDFPERRSSTSAAPGASGTAVPNGAAAPAAQDPQRFSDALAQANRLIGSSARNLQFRADPDSQGSRVNVVDPETGNTLRSMSTEELLAIGKALDRMPGLMLKLKA